MANQNLHIPWLDVVSIVGAVCIGFLSAFYICDVRQSKRFSDGPWPQSLRGVGDGSRMTSSLGRYCPSMVLGIEFLMVGHVVLRTSCGGECRQIEADLDVYADDGRMTLGEGPRERACF